jgi:hypothetical protein
MAFENRVLRRIFVPKRDDVTSSQETRKLLNEKLRNLYLSKDITIIKSRTSTWAEHVARMGEMRNEYTNLVLKPGGKRPLGRPKGRWEYSIKNGS